MEEGGGLQGLGDFSPPCFTEIHINFWLKFQSSLLCPFQGRTAQSQQQRQQFHFGACLIPEKLLLLSSFEKQKFEVFYFCPETLFFHSFIKALNTFEMNFLIKKDYFFVCFAKLHSLNHLCHPLGCFGSSVQPPALTAPDTESSQAGPAPSWAVWLGSGPCPATLVGCWSWQWGWAAAAWSQAAPVLPFLRAGVVTRVPALISSLGNYVCSTSFLLLVQVFGLFDFTAPGLLRAGGADFRAGWSISPKHTLLCQG